MANCNYLRNIGMTCGGLVILFVLISFIFPKLMTIGLEEACGTKDCSRYNMGKPFIINNPNDETKHGMFQVIETSKGNNAKWNEEEMIHKVGGPLRIVSQDSIQRNYKFFPNVEHSEKDIFKFNIKWNSFSKESNDMLD